MPVRPVCRRAFAQLDRPLSATWTAPLMVAAFVASTTSSSDPDAGSITTDGASYQYLDKLGPGS
jgi:hypothetical protein